MHLQKHSHSIQEQMGHGCNRPCAPVVQHESTEGDEQMQAVLHWPLCSQEEDGEGASSRPHCGQLLWHVVMLSHLPTALPPAQGSEGCGMGRREPWGCGANCPAWEEGPC